MKRIRWDRFQARLGIVVCVAGFVLIFIGWNGAASVDRVASQFPYLISGGIAGLALVVIGAALIIVDTSRDERERLREEIVALRQVIEDADLGGRRAAAEAKAVKGEFVRGQTSYHRPNCRLLEGRGELPRVTGAEAAELGLIPCRVCEPQLARTPAPAKRGSRRPSATARGVRGRNGRRP